MGRDANAKVGLDEAAAGVGEIRVFVWRLNQLVGAGFAGRLAVEIARRRSYDVYALLDLVQLGCPPRLAARILAPLDDE